MPQGSSAPPSTRCAQSDHGRRDAVPPDRPRSLRRTSGFRPLYRGVRSPAAIAVVGSLGWTKCPNRLGVAGLRSCPQEPTSAAWATAQDPQGTVATDVVPARAGDIRLVRRAAVDRHVPDRVSEAAAHSGQGAVTVKVSRGPASQRPTNAIAGTLVHDSQVAGPSPSVGLGVAV